MHLRVMSGLGLLAMLGLAWAMSEQRRRISWRLVLWGVGLQAAVGVLMLKTPLRDRAFAWIRDGVGVLNAATLEGSGFLFGRLVRDPDFGVIVAFQVLPVIIFVSALSGVLYHLRVIQAVVWFMTWLMRRTLRTSGAETLGAALLVFLGIESVTALRGYLKEMTRSELCTVMTTFMATIAGSVMVVYATFGAEPGHLLAASLMSAPAAIVVAKMLVPETGDPATQGAVRLHIPVESHNVVDAAARGASEGLMLALHVAAMLIAFIGLVYLADLAVAAVTGYAVRDFLGWAFRPFAWLMGVPRADIAAVGGLLGTKTALNEFLAYVDLQQTAVLTERGRTIATYALCGFANPGSLGILIAGLTSLMPERRREVVQLGLKSFVGGTLACFMTACVAGVLVYA